MAKLTSSERHVLRFPPTESTWLCGGKVRFSLPGEEGHKLIPCGVVNPGTRKSCWLCGHKKAAKPKLLWPVYVKACQKAGIQPGERHDQRDAAPTTAPKRKRQRRK